MLLENKGLMLLKVIFFLFKNNTLNEGMLNTKQTKKTTQNDLHFGLIFLICWLIDLVVNSRVYQVYLEFI